jgi:hypothetical protein
MQEAPAPAIPPLDSTPDPRFCTRRHQRWQPKHFLCDTRPAQTVVIFLMSPAKSSHESPAGTGTDDSVAAERAAGMPAAEEGTKAVAEGSVGDSQNAGARLGGTSVQCSDQAPVAPKAAATCKQWSLDSKVYALEMLYKVMPASARRQCFLAGPCVTVVMAANKPRFCASSLLSMVERSRFGWPCMSRCCMRDTFRMDKAVNWS